MPLKDPILGNCSKCDKTNVLLCTNCGLCASCSEHISCIATKQKELMYGLILVEGGTFNNGKSSITLSSFYIGKYEVTQKEWQEVMGNNPSNFKGENLPVEQITWYDAVEFCNKLSKKEGLAPAYTIIRKEVSFNWHAEGYRLPTILEWEYAARGGGFSKGHKYSGSDNIDKVGWYSENSGGTTHAIGTKIPNELGIST